MEKKSSVMIIGKRLSEVQNGCTERSGECMLSVRLFGT